MNAKMTNFSDIKQKECIRKNLPGGVTLNASRTLVMQSVINTIKTHGRSSMDKEVCGILVGNLCWDKRAYLLIDACIEGKFAEHQAGSVTFTSETWNYIHSELAEKYPDKRIVGWYHTHPGFGIFLSGMDLFIHENFFEMKWQTAYVFDPQAETEGFFFWNDKKLEQGEVTVIQDEPQADKEPPESFGKKFKGPDSGEQEKARRRVHPIKIILLSLILLTGSFAILVIILHKQAEAGVINHSAHDVEECKRLFEKQRTLLIQLQKTIAEIQKDQDTYVKMRRNPQPIGRDKKMLHQYLCPCNWLQGPCKK